MSILILPPNHTEDDSAIWRAAIDRGVSPLRCQQPEDYAAEIGTTPLSDVFYCGNTLHYRRVTEAGLALRAAMLDPLWVRRVDESVFGRRVTPMTYGEFSRLESTEKFFVKHVHEKWFKPLICAPADIPKGSSQDADILHVQGVMNFVDEVRCWIVDGQIVTWSYYRRNGSPWRQGVTDEPPLPEWSALVGDVTPFLPLAIVVDVGIAEGSDRWHVIEANEPWASGIYDSDPAACLTVIVEAQKPA